MRRAAAALVARATRSPGVWPTTSARPASTAAAGENAAPSSSSPDAPASPPSPPPPPTRHPQFTVVGRLTGRVQIERSPVYAVVELGGSQAKLSPDDLIYTDRLPGVSVQDVLRLDRVLAVGTRTATRIGRPVLEGVALTAAVEEVTLDAKVTHFHKRRRKASRRLTGHRQPVTALRVLSVEGVEV